MDRYAIDPETHAAWLAKRVLEYGRWSNWQPLVAHDRKLRLAEIVVTLRSLQPRALAFCQAWFQRPPAAFRYCTSTSSRIY